MATAVEPAVTEPTSVQAPLARLAGTIRRYVLIESALAVGIFFACWFWLALAADFGSFKLLNVDWVQEFPRSFRGVLLIGILVGLAGVVVFKLMRRLWVDFKPASLALVLEKKFFNVLGDRLITAVELADVGRAESQGYSRAMIDETIREASVLVDKVPYQDVFDWARLKRLATWLVVLTIGPGLLFGVIYSAIRRTNPIHDFVPKFAEVAGIWVKRDVLLRNVIWPRKAMLEVLDFPASGQLKISREGAAPRLQVQAYRWVWADPSAPEGWRPMMWSDLTPALLGVPVPERPKECGVGPDWPLDVVERMKNENNIGQEYDTLFATLTARAADRKMNPVFRRLEVPERVEVKYWGPQTQHRIELIRGSNWEYTGLLSDLKESVQFWVRGEDYYTATRQVTLVPPPTLQELRRVELRPAYQFYRPPTGSPPDGGPLALRGLKQRVNDVASLNGPMSRITLPYGTDLTLEATVDKELTDASFRPTGENATSSRVELAADRMGFTHRFGSITSKQDFDFEFTDTDGVRSMRHVVVEPFADSPPVVNVMIDGIRRTAQGHYMVTPMAQIPFDGKVADGLAGQPGGLDRVDYTLTYTKMQSSGDVNAQASWLVGSLLPAIGTTSAQGLGLQAWAIADVAKQMTNAAPETATRSFAMETFQQLQNSRSANDLTRTELLSRLQQEPKAGLLIKEFVVQPRFESLDLRARMPELKIKDELAVQPRYRMKLTVTATDNNVETGPGVAPNQEPPFTVMIVSEPELLVEVARDEEALHLKTEDAILRLREARQKLEKTIEELRAANTDQLATFGQRAQEALDATERAHDQVQEVFHDYSRILRELELNRVTDKLIAKVRGEICMPLESVLKSEFLSATESLEVFRKELDASRKPTGEMIQQAQSRLDRLISRLTDIMNAMGEVTTINKLIAALREIEKGQEQSIGPRLRELQRIQREKLMEKLKGLEDEK